MAVQHAFARDDTVSHCVHLQGYMFWVQVLGHTQMLCWLTEFERFLARRAVAHLVMSCALTVWPLKAEKEVLVIRQ